MSSGSYPFIDLAVLDGLRERLCAGEPVVLLDNTLDTVLLANGSGARLLGFSSPFNLVGNDPELGISARRQINSLQLFNSVGSTGSLALRLVSGVESRMVMAKLSSIALPDGELGLVLSTAIESSDIKNAIDGLAGDGTHAAVLDGEASLIGASDDFERLGISQFDLATLVRDTSREDDRMVKRRLRVGARNIPIGVGRLSEDPARYIALAIGDIEQESMPVALKIQPASDDIVATNAVAEAAPELSVTQNNIVFDEPNERAISPVQPDEAIFAANFTYDPEAAPTRFVWKIDGAGFFNFVSPEFSSAVGPHAADIVGRTFREVAQVFGLDPGAEITDLLERHDTWSGRSVFWPIEGTDLRAPVDLAALPVYDRERRFEGFRGFGIVRLADAVIDPEAIGLALAKPAATLSRDDDATNAPNDVANTTHTSVSANDSNPDMNGLNTVADAPILVVHDLIDDVDDEFESDPWQGEVPALEISPAVTPAPFDQNVIRLEERRATRDRANDIADEGTLSPVERNAFREIAERLRREGLITPEPLAQDIEPAAQASDMVVDASSSEIARSDEDASIVSDFAYAQADSGDYEVDSEALGDLAKMDGAEAQNFALEEVANEGDANHATSAQTSDDGSNTQSGDGELPDASADETPSSLVNPVDEAPILSRLPIPILVHNGDELLFANQAFFDITGYRSLGDLRDAGGLEHLFRPGADDGETPGASNSVLHTAYGTDVPVRAHLHSVAWKGGHALLLSMRQVDATAPAPSSDVTDLKQEVAELSSVLETATDGVIFLNNDNTIRDINQSAEALFGFDPAMVVGKPFTQLFAVESQRIASDYLSNLNGTGVASLMNDGREVIGREAHGRFIPLFMTIGRLAGANGYCAVLRDITQWKRAEEELNAARRAAEHASTQKSEFLARVSHEIRTPLNAIIGFSDLMTEERFGPVGNLRYLDYLKDINRSGRHVLDLVNDLLDISKIEAGQQEMDFEAVSLNEALSEAVSMMQPQANRERVIIRSSFASELPEVVADLRSIKQIALNLLSNAVRYTGAGGQVIISTSYELTGGVVVRVRDTGVGMSAQEIEQAMKPFKQINALKRERGDGTGLGLPLTKAMVEANRAAFIISSTPGQGTLVEITFPSTRVLAD
jgi:PAS domain S-box-containing protein